MNKNDLKGKTALITGAAKRLGRATALALAEQGVHLALHYRQSLQGVKSLQDEISQTGIKSWLIKADFSQMAECEDMIEKANSVAGSIHILINNASIFPESTVESVTLDDVNSNVQLNAWAPFVIGRAFAKQADNGHIINFLDTRIKSLDVRHVAYHWSKHMLDVMTKMMAVEFAPGIQVNAVAPGLVLPPEGQTREYLERLKHTTLLNKYGDAADVAEAVVFLIKSDFITGQTIFVDGGRHLKDSTHDSVG